MTIVGIPNSGVPFNPIHARQNLIEIPKHLLEAGWSHYVAILPVLYRVRTGQLFTHREIPNNHRGGTASAYEPWSTLIEFTPPSIGDRSAVLENGDSSITNLNPWTNRNNVYFDTINSERYFTTDTAAVRQTLANQGAPVTRLHGIFLNWANTPGATGPAQRTDGTIRYL